MFPELGVLQAAILWSCVGAAIVLLFVGVRGTVAQVGKPPTRAAELVGMLRSPALASRAAAAVLVAIATLLVTRWPVAAVGMGALVLMWPTLFGGNRAEQAEIARLEALVMWTESLHDTISAHASLEQAIPTTTENASPLIRPALLRLVGRIRAHVPMDTALLALAEDMDDASADMVIAALILSVRRRGDRLAEVLKGLAAAAREELDSRRRVSAGRAGLRRGVQIVILVTVGFAGFLSVFGGGYVKPYSTPAGQVVMAVVIGIFALGFSWMRKLAGSAPIPPFLARPGQAAQHDDVQIVASLTGLSPAAAASLTNEVEQRALAAKQAASR